MFLAVDPGVTNPSNYDCIPLLQCQGPDTVHAVSLARLSGTLKRIAAIIIFHTLLLLAPVLFSKI